MKRLSVLGIGLALVLSAMASAADNKLTSQEKKDGWILLFNGKNYKGWMNTREGKPKSKPPGDGTLNPHHCGGYVLIHEKKWENFTLSFDFKLSEGANSGLFVRTFPLDPRRDGLTWQKGIEIQLLDSDTAGYHDTGAIYDMVAPSKNMLNPLGEWNNMVVTCKDSLVLVAVNGEDTTRCDLNDFTTPLRRPDGTEHKFNKNWSKHPRSGYLGFQDHGGDIWVKNIKILPQ